MFGSPLSFGGSYAFIVDATQHGNCRTVHCSGPVRVCPFLAGHALPPCVFTLLPQGIVFSVRPPKKSWKNISNLSGGEKTLSSLSLVFALHTYKPNPLYVMDEIDAALGGCRGKRAGRAPAVRPSQGKARGTSAPGQVPVLFTLREPACDMAPAPTLSSSATNPHAVHPPCLPPPRAIPRTRPALLSPADFKNVSIVGHYIKERTAGAQVRGRQRRGAGQHLATPLAPAVGPQRSLHAPPFQRLLLHAHMARRTCT